MEFEEILQLHYQKYPFMQTEDMLKLAYQNEFGCGHLVNSPEDSQRAIKNEIQSCIRRNDKGTKTAEDIGNGYARIMLNACSIEDWEPISKMFVLSAGARMGNPDRYVLNKEAAKKFAYSLLPDEKVTCFFKEYEKTGGLSPCHHSRIYTDAYNPAYRVVLAEFAEYIDVFYEINRVIKEKSNCVISIDGGACSGKTHLANLLASVFDFTLIHTDSFFLPKEKRTPERLEEPGGNFDRERFAEEVVGPLKRKENGVYGIYSCKINGISEKKRIYKDRPTLIEGSYCNHTFFGDYCDLRIFLDTPEEICRQRLEKRETPEKLEMFENVWLPAEKRYFETLNVKDRCDIIAKEKLEV